MKKIILLALCLAGCNEQGNNISACKRMCEPRLVKDFQADSNGKVSCVCEDRLPSVETPK